MGRRYFIFGVIFLLLGLQLRLVDSYVLTPKASQFIETKLKNAGVQTQNGLDNNLLFSAGPYPKKTLIPPRWIGWALLSVGAVLALHAMTLQRVE